MQPAPFTNVDTREQALARAAELVASNKGAQISEVRPLSVVVVFSRKHIIRRFIYGDAPSQWAIKG